MYLSAFVALINCAFHPQITCVPRMIIRINSINSLILLLKKQMVFYKAEIQFLNVSYIKFMYESLN
jgi:hypothetical protein